MDADYFLVFAFVDFEVLRLIQSDDLVEAEYGVVHSLSSVRV